MKNSLSVADYYEVPVLDHQAENSPLVDIHTKLKPLLAEDEFLKCVRSNKLIIGSFDLANTCTRACGWCCFDAKSPEEIKTPKEMTAESFLSFMANERTQHLLSPFGITFGKIADAIEHPDIVKIIENLLKNFGSKEGKIGITTNYRIENDEKLFALNEISKINSYFGLAVSITPINQNLFNAKELSLETRDGKSIKLNWNVRINKLDGIFEDGGAMPSAKKNELLGQRESIIKALEFPSYLYLNPDGLWAEWRNQDSYTTSFYAPLTPENWSNILQY